MLVPWSPFWERNYFLTALPVLHEIVRNNYLRERGLGMGVVNLLMGFYEWRRCCSRAPPTGTMETIDSHDLP